MCGGGGEVSGRCGVEIVGKTRRATREGPRRGGLSLSTRCDIINQRTEGHGWRLPSLASWRVEAHEKRESVRTSMDHGEGV
jgi:hypothetical protein